MGSKENGDRTETENRNVQWKMPDEGFNTYITFYSTIG